MKPFISLLTALLLAAAPLSLAAQTERQRPEPQEKKLKPAASDPKAAAQRRARELVATIGLKGDTVQWFTDLYTAYRDTLQRSAVKIRASRSILRTGRPTDTEADSLIVASFAADVQAAAIKAAYYARFRERLTPRQLLFVFATPRDATGLRPERRDPGAQPGRGNGFPGRTPGFPRMGDASFGEE
ncbi:MAG: hypothetical protein ACI353_01155 [Alloprevotella sp.]